MTTLAYMTLATSTGTTKRFRVLMGSLKESDLKNQNRKRTANGRSDNTEGAVFRSWVTSVKVRNVSTGTDPDGASYAVRADLETFYGYNNPNGTPTNRFTFTDHLGNTATVELVGQMDKENITPYLDGVNSWFVIPIAFERVN